MLDPMDGGAGRADGFGRPTVVIVDSESLYRWFVVESLGGEGMSVLQFKNLADAAGHLDGRRLPELMLVDAQALSDEGVESLVALRQRLPALQCLVLEPAGPSTIPSAVEGPPTVPKPVDPEAVRRLVRSHIQYVT